VLAPELLLSDVVRPELNGVELAIKLHLLCPEFNVLLISDQAETDDLLHKARKAGHNFELLPKPLHPLILLANVERLFPTSSTLAQA
jgi:DNA-binding NtrC family response regulator